MADAELAAIEELVEAVHGHARTLALLAPTLRERGVASTREDMVELMADIDHRFPGQREKSLFASVELSLRRLSPDARQRARVLGVFHGGVDPNMLRVMMEWEMADVLALARELVGVGLATPNPYEHLSLHPALCPYLRNLFDDTERNELTGRWAEAMTTYVEFLYQDQFQDAQRARTLTLLGLPNLMALLVQSTRGADPEATVFLTTRLLALLALLGRPHLLMRIGDARSIAEARLDTTWNHARFEAAQSRIEQELARGQIGDAQAAAHKLLDQAHAAGEHAYPNADYDLAGACFWLGRALQTAGASQRAVPYLEEAQQRFEAVAKARPSRGVARMVSLCAAERGYCLANLGRLDEAAAAFEEQIRRASREQEDRDLAVAKVQLASVRKDQHRYQDALGTFTEARDLFARLGEPGSVAVIWHQIGMVHRTAGEPERAEDAYRQSLALEVQLGNVRGQAQTLAELGNLYDSLGRLDEAASQRRRSADHFVSLDDVRSEGAVRNNLANTLCKLRRWNEARPEIQRAIECKEGLGHGAMPWTSWTILADIETGAGRTDLAAEAKARARDCYLAHRRDGGENHNDDGRIALAVTKQLLAGGVAGATADLDQLLAHPELLDQFRPFVVALRAIATGSRDRSLADAPELYYTSAAEILVLIDTLEAAAAGAA